MNNWQKIRFVYWALGILTGVLLFPAMMNIVEMFIDFAIKKGQNE